MYWWSNIATPEFEGGRIIVPADSAYNNSDGTGIAKSSIPFDRGVDVSYPERIPNTIDYFMIYLMKIKSLLPMLIKTEKDFAVFHKTIKGQKAFQLGPYSRLKALAGVPD